MKAMILAAGEGRRMRPLTQHTPKPLLKAGGITLLERHIVALRDAGINDIVVNAAYLAEQIVAFCGSGSRWGVRIAVSVEAQALETAGGIINALPLLGASPFILLNGDVFCDFPLTQFTTQAVPERGAHILLVNNPAHHKTGDFVLDGQAVKPIHNATPKSQPLAQALTYAGLGVYDPRFFYGYPTGKRPLKPLMDTAIAQGRLQGTHWQGQWLDVGTPERLARLDATLSGAS
jgi:MurNAc alpha-1-phosphate uridylyltransferase